MRHRGGDALFFVQLGLPNLLEVDDGICLQYRSEGKLECKAAQIAAFEEVISYISFGGPSFLRTHASQWNLASLNVLRPQASILRSRMSRRPRREWSPLVRLEVSRETWTSASPMGLSACTGTTNDCVVLGPLNEFPLSRHVSSYPRSVLPNLKKELPERGLLPFLRRFPNKFAVLSERPLVWKRVS